MSKQKKSHSVRHLVKIPCPVPSKELPPPSFVAAGNDA
jgi:hypothetical protein